MRWRVYIMTYVTWACMHILRMSFPFVQEFVIASYHTDKLFLGSSSLI